MKLAKIIKYFIPFLLFSSIYATMPPLYEEGWDNFEQLTTNISRFDKKGNLIATPNTISYYDPYPAISSTINPLVVLVSFNNMPFHENKSFDYFEELLYQPNTKSLADYFKENSGNQFFIINNINDGEQFILNLPGNFKNYEGSIGAMIAGTLCPFLDEKITDFSRFDANDDNIVDALIVIHSANAVELNPFSNNALQSHKNNVILGANNYYPTSDGFQIIDYIILSQNSPLGTFCHEFGHILGLPDLYNTKTGQPTCSKWALMDAGGWGGYKGDTPTHLSAWSKEYLGWSTVKTVSDNANNLQIFPTENIDNNDTTFEAFRFEVENFDEYYLLEYRDETIGRYSPLPGSGYLFWHIAKNTIEAYLDNNLVNANNDNRGLDLIEADGQDRTFLATNLFQTHIYNPKTFDSHVLNLRIILNGLTFDVIASSDTIRSYKTTENSKITDFYSFPNPFLPSKHNKITFLAKTTSFLTHPTFTLYDIRGKVILNDNNFAEYLNPQASSDYNFIYEFEWDGYTKVGDKVASGVYIALLTNENEKKATKIALII
ncbi:MAG: M6 family metalloprotease domain-containing protein [bacterium]|nr:M6 family metalloprotease domain-containing protein [bacterium]